MQFELGDQFFKILMQALELAVPEFSDFGAASLLVSDLEHIYYLAAAVGLMVDDLWL